MGARALLQDIGRNHQLWIYTTSLRTGYKIRLWLRAFNVKIAGVINTDSHNERVCGTAYQKFSKAPKLFGIDCLIDDSDGVAIECEQQGVPCIVVNPKDLHWTDTVRRRLFALTGQ